MVPKSSKPEAAKPGPPLIDRWGKNQVTSFDDPKISNIKMFKSYPQPPVTQDILNSRPCVWV